jgi:2-polyprenyl-3-methyl-5-hydroxy-6-metoxy-1,4-benzoquinol methylase
MSEPRLQITSKETRLSSPWWGIHEARYRFALGYVSGDRLLDVACGTGYGLPILLGAVKCVVGVDVDLPALVSATRELGGLNGSVVAANGCCLPFNNDAFDAITSFETIEHLQDRTTFVRELVRVLAPTGVCIFSTPNAIYTRPVNGKPRNPYHVYEYSPSEFRAFLAKHFSSVLLVGQRLRPTFAISPFWDDQQNLHTARELGRLVWWRVLNRLPRFARESLSQAVWGHPFAPSSTDYEFIASAVDDAPVQVAICESPIK